MFMRQIVADAISKFQKITRQMLCDKCSKNDVTLIPKKCKPVGTGIVALYKDHIFFTINVMRQMFMRQIDHLKIPKFQNLKIPSQNSKRSRDKCSKNDVTLIPQTSYGGNITLVLKMLTSIGVKITLYGGY
jgi:hypothetical protein